MLGDIFKRGIDAMVAVLCLDFYPYWDLCLMAPND